jgi:hypothetical protein
MTPTRTLHLGKGLNLPIDSATETFAILGRRGSGKTHTAVVMAEEMLGAGIPDRRHRPARRVVGPAGVEGRQTGGTADLRRRRQPCGHPAVGRRRPCHGRRRRRQGLLDRPEHSPPVEDGPAPVRR